jgi:hypothetical protein
MAENKHGPSNLTMTMDGSDIVLRFSPAAIIKPKGEVLPGDKLDANGQPKRRVYDLVSTSHGFTPFGGCRVSLNVTGVS